MKSTAAVIGGGLAVLLVVVGLWALTVAWAPWKGAGDVRKQTQGNASFRIASYNSFYDECAAAQTMQQNLNVTRAQIKAATDPGEKARQETNLQAQLNQLHALVNQYNADARKTGTSGQFRASDLPFALDSSQEISCTA